MQEWHRGRLFRIISMLLACSFSPAHGETGVINTRILLGQSAGLSRLAAQMLRQLLIGAKACFDKINNKQGGVHCSDDNHAIDFWSDNHNVFCALTWRP